MAWAGRLKLIRRQRAGHRSSHCCCSPLPTGRSRRSAAKLRGGGPRGHGASRLSKASNSALARRESGSANFSRSSLNRRRKCSRRICQKRKGKNGRTQEDVSAAGPAVGPDQGPLEQGRPSHCPGSRAGRRRSLDPRTTSSVRAGLSMAYSASAISPSTCTRRGRLVGS